MKELLIRDPIDKAFVLKALGNTKIDKIDLEGVINDLVQKVSSTIDEVSSECWNRGITAIAFAKEFGQIYIIIDAFIALGEGKDQPMRIVKPSRIILSGGENKKQSRGEWHNPYPGNETHLRGAV